MTLDKLSRYVMSSRKSVSCLLISSAMSVSAFAAESQLISRYLPTKSTISALDLAGLQKDKIIVKFKEGTGVRGGSGDFFVKPESFFSQSFTLPNIELELVQLEDYVTLTGASFNSLFSFGEEALSQLKITGEQRSGKELADLNLYFEIPVPTWLSDSSTVSFVNFINSMPSVEIAYLNPEVSAAATDTPDFTPLQTFKAPAPNGMDIDYAHTFVGGKGEDVTFVDVEGAWVETHEDMPELFYQNGIEKTTSNWINHGTAVVALIGAPANGFGIEGIAANALIGTESFDPGIAIAITNAALAVGNGGVILLEMQISGPTSLVCQSYYTEDNCDKYIPVEHQQSVFDAIQTATANGVIVVEAAGNGGISLEDPALNGLFDRSNRDSGAIIVGAGHSGQRTPMVYSDAGERVDVHAWGQNVMTAGYGSHYTKSGDSGNQDFWYTSSFSGTSSASALTAGVVVSMQGIALAATGNYLTPEEMRSLLVQTGTPQEYYLHRPVGPMPNMRAAIEQIGGVEITCEDYSDTLDNHVLASRASVVEETSCLFGTYFCTTTYEFLAVGSGELLGTSGSTVVDLKADLPGYYNLGSCPAGPDTVAPVITPLGDSPLSVTLNAQFVDPGVTASDDRDGDITANVTTTGYVDSTTLGSYVLSYDVSDAAGNAATTFDRMVNVVEGSTCFESTLANHVTAARAYEQYSLYYATGTASYLGSTYSDANKVVALEETTPGNWSLVTSCN